jgi:hypothetical protein
MEEADDSEAANSGKRYRDGQLANPTEKWQSGVLERIDRPRSTLPLLRPYYQVVFTRYSLIGKFFYPNALRVLFAKPAHRTRSNPFERNWMLDAQKSAKRVNHRINNDWGVVTTTAEKKANDVH